MTEAMTVLRELAAHRASTRLLTSDDARAILAHIDSLTAEPAAKEAEIARLQDVLQHIGTVGTCDPFSSDPAKSCFHIARAALKGADHGRD